MVRITAPAKNMQQVIDRIEHTATSHPLPFRALPNFPMAVKETEVSKKGHITSWLTVYNNDDGTPFIDPYQDIIVKGAFTATIAALEKQRKTLNSPWLCPDLFNHDRNAPIGGIAELREETKGVVYVAHINMGTQQGREVIELVAQKQLGSSYGYDPVGFDFVPGTNIRQLKAIGLREVSQVTFPANPLGGFIDVKHVSYPGYPTKACRIDALVERMVQSVVGDEREQQCIADAEMDRQWREARARAARDNPLAFAERARFNSWGH